MRTKALLGLAALAVSAATCVAQSNVYSLNIVGYVNVDITNGFNFINLPLKPSDGNYNITNTIVMPAGADGASLFKWTGTAYSSTIPTWVDGMGWYTEQAISIGLGESFFIDSPVTGKITFVGEVQTGAIANTIPAGMTPLGNKVPATEAWPGKTVGNDGDTIFVWNKAQKRWDSTLWGFVAGEGWFDGTAFSGGPVLAPGQGVFYQNLGAAINWTQNFNP